RTVLVLEHRQLAEDVARTEVRERDRATVGMLADGARVAGAHDVAGVALVALAEDDLPRLVPARHGDLGDARKLLGPERLERRDAGEQRDRVLHARRGHMSYVSGDVARRRAACGRWRTKPPDRRASRVREPPAQAVSRACSRRRRLATLASGQASAASSATGSSAAA